MPYPLQGLDERFAARARSNSWRWTVSLILGIGWMTTGLAASENSVATDLRFVFGGLFLLQAGVALGAGVGHQRVRRFFGVKQDKGAERSDHIAHLR